MKRLRSNAYYGVCFFGGLVFFAPAALLVRTRAGVSAAQFFLLQALLSGVIAAGEIPAGWLTDRIGYAASLKLSQALMLLARLMLLGAFLKRSMALFVAEALVEGIAVCFLSGTGSAYLYAVCGEESYLACSARAANFGTAGFIISTAAYAGIYRLAGLEGLIVGTALTALLGLACALCLPREGAHAAAVRQNTWAQLKRLFSSRRALLLTAMLALLGVAWILVNFFYAERLEACGVALEWMSAIIIAYSAVQMLAEPIVARLKRCGKAGLPALLCALGGAALIAFGLLSGTAAVLMLMVLLPLLLALPELYLEEGQNRLIDQLGMGGSRAAALSMMNVGVSLVEIVSLFTSSAIAAFGAGRCFALCGALLAACAIPYFRMTK